MYSAPQNYKSFQRVRVIEDVYGWPIDAIGYFEPIDDDKSMPGLGRVWNETGTDFAFHRLGASCTPTVKKCNLKDTRLIDVK